MKIVIPYHPGNIGRAYNNAMSDAKPGEWVVMLDGDVLMLTDKWHARLDAALNAMDQGEVGIVSCVTNRTAGLCQQAERWYWRVPLGDDIAEHRKAANGGEPRHRSVDCTDAQETHKSLNGALSGHMIATHRDTWARVNGFEERICRRDVMIGGEHYKYECNGFTGVDTAYYLDVCAAGYRAIVLTWLYCYHGRWTSSHA